MTRYFFIVGAQRSGTTYLYQLLDEHPQVEMAKPRRPEPKFFLSDRAEEVDLDYYVQTYFQPDAEPLLRGEKSTSYIEYPDAARRILRWFPTAKIIFLLRNPVERALSNYRFSVANGLETRPAKEAILAQTSLAFDSEHISVSPYAYLERSCYLDYIRTYENIVPKSQMIVLIAEELFGNQQQIQSLYQQLGASEGFVPPSLESTFNAAPSLDISPEVIAGVAEKLQSSTDALESYLGRSLDVWR